MTVRVAACVAVATSIAVGVAGGGAASAAPAADVVMVWAPGESPRPIEDVARARGAAVIDLSPPVQPVAETAQFLQRGVAAYQAIRFGEAQTALDQARDLADQSGAAGLTNAQLSDLFLYRGLVRAAQGDDAAAWDELVTATVVHPTRTLDPNQYAPKIAALLANVQDNVLREHPQATLAVDAPAGCTVLVDGDPVAGPVLRVTGSHWVRVTCAGAQPWATRVELTRLDVHVQATPVPYARPDDAALLVQARVAGASALVAVEVDGGLAVVRLIGADGRERDRRTVEIRGDLAPIAPVVDAMLAPKVVARHWYQSRWTWAAAGAAVAAAVAVPLTAALVGGGGATSFSVRPKGFNF